MAKKDEPAKKNYSGKHATARWMTALPERYKEPFASLAKENRRTAVAEITLALDAWLKAAGKPVPEPEE